MTAARFDALPVLPALKRALGETFRYETMTSVQARAIAPALDASDLLVKARTGTGKTLAFLLPALHRVLSRPGREGIGILVVSPTRELAQQIGEEARMLLSFLKGVSLQIVVGGTPLGRDLAQVRRSGVPTVLVATPGRLLDHLGNPESGFLQGVQALDVLVLDEADRLLDMGFAPDLRRVFQVLPDVSCRQTLLFSATMPNDVANMARMALKRDYQVVDCVGEEENTHLHVAQSVLVTPIEEQMTALGVLLMECMKVPDYKIIVFFTTARLTQFCSELFERMGRPVLEIHSRKSQMHRTRVSDRFRKEKSVIMFTSDVTARGLDYPDVSTVIQVGLPADKAQYIHRIGRTARAGKGGSGVLLLADFEAHPFLSSAKDLPLQPIDKLPEDATAAMRGMVQTATSKVGDITKISAYQAWLGFYNGKLKMLRWNKDEVVSRANEWARHVAGLEQPPALFARTVGKMNLKGVPGLRIEGVNGVPRSEKGSYGNSGRGRGGGRRGGRGGGRGRSSYHGGVSG